MAAATQSRKMHCNATKGNLIAIPVWRPQFFFLHDICIAAQPIEDQASFHRVFRAPGHGSSTGSMSGNCEYDRNKKSYDNGKLNNNHKY